MNRLQNISYRCYISRTQQIQRLVSRLYPEWSLNMQMWDKIKTLNVYFLRLSISWLQKLSKGIFVFQFVTLFLLL